MKADKLIVLTLCFLFPLLSVSSPGVRSLGGLPYHPDEKEGALTLYNLGNTAFAIDDYSETEVKLNLGYTHAYGYQKDYPDQGLTSDIVTFSDAADPHQGLFYRLNLGDNLPQTLLMLSAGSESIPYKSSGGEDSSSWLKEGKIALSSKLHGFYLGGFFLYRHWSQDGLETQGYEEVYDSSYAVYPFLGKKAKTSYGNPYYQLALGYEFSPKVKVGLSFDNIYSLSRTRQKESVEESAILGDFYAPYLTLDQFKNPLYRFDGTQTEWFSGPHYNSYSSYYYYLHEKTRKNQTAHFSLPVSARSNLLAFTARLDYHRVEYETDIQILEDNWLTASGLSYTFFYTKKGTLSSLSYDFNLALLPGSGPARWQAKLNFQGTFSGKIKETIRLNEPLDNNYLSQEIQFNRQKLSLTLGYQKPQREFWGYLAVQNQTIYYREYTNFFGGGNGPLSPWFPEMYPGAYSNDPNALQGQKKDWQVYSAGVAGRQKLENWVWDAGLSFLYTKTPADFKIAVLKPVLSAFYFWNARTQIGLEYAAQWVLGYHYEGGNTYQSMSYSEADAFDSRSFSQGITLIYRQKF